MTTIEARCALLDEGWRENVQITIDDEGRIASVAADAEGTSGTDAANGSEAGGTANVDAAASTATPASTTVEAPGKGGTHHVDVLLPAMANVHSHSFQRAVAGLTEARGPDASDSFWTWRKLMYRFLERLTPDDVEAIAAFAFLEMLETGYASVGEFHYVHHAPGGQPYDNIAELAARIEAAARDVGIGLTLLPVLYETGGCDGRALAGGQLRFGNDIDRFSTLLDAIDRHDTARTADFRLGVAPHSLRAVSRPNLTEAIRLRPHDPVHLHLAEQTREVEEVQQHYGATPVAWLLDNLPVDDRFCLVHCTQMTHDETRDLAASGSVAGLCPLTESNLGDGIFNGVAYLDAGGRIGFGSDSNIRISLFDELCTLEYSQRLRDHSRAALATGSDSSGRRLFDAGVRGGAQAIGRGKGSIATGEWADLIAIDRNHPALAARSGDVLLDTLMITGSTRGMITDVWSAGRHGVREGRHPQRERIIRRYMASIERLLP